jgi:peptidoglycan-associated lipoprotein
MRLKSLFTVLVLGSVCLALGSGCRMFKRGGGSNEDMLDFEVLDGDQRLFERFEGLERVTGVDFSPVYFGYDSFQIDGGEIRKIEDVGDYLRANSNVKLITEGHCDERGSREYNVALGEHRALAVRAHLIGIGIDAQRIQTRSYGEERPVVTGHDESSWRQNRRVEFALFR